MPLVTSMDCIFQSTPPVKAATFAKFQKLLPKIFQSTPPVKAATEEESAGLTDAEISIHAAREGGDTYTAISTHTMRGFQSTPPVKAAT